MAASVATRSSVSMSRIMRLLRNHRPLLLPLPHKQRQYRRKEKEQNIQKPKHPTSLQHRTSLIGPHTSPIDIKRSQRRTSTDQTPSSRPIRAVPSCSGAKGVDGADEGAHEEEIDEGYEEGVVAAAVVGEEGGDGPGRAEDGHDEEDQDVIWGEGVGFAVAVYEVG